MALCFPKPTVGDLQWNSMEFISGFRAVPRGRSQVVVAQVSHYNSLHLIGTTRLKKEQYNILNGCAQALRQAHISVPFLCSERLRIPLLGLIVAIVHC